jgi:nucleoside 2-deoxyribosyltransferase
VKVYLAAPYAARDQVKDYAAELTRIGFTITSTWLNETHDINAGTTGAATGLSNDQVALHAAADLHDIDQSDLLVAITAKAVNERGGSGGRHVETGYAIALGKPVVVVGEPENVFHRLGSACTIVPTWHEAVIELSARLVQDRRPGALAG